VRVYHDIRREVLFEARGQFGVYNENHPDDVAAGNHAKLLLHRGHPVGVIRIDVSGTRTCGCAGSPTQHNMVIAPSNVRRALI
jgi:hypothetical protein